MELFSTRLAEYLIKIGVNIENELNTVSRLSVLFSGQAIWQTCVYPTNVQLLGLISLKLCKKLQCRCWITMSINWLILHLMIISNWNSQEWQEPCQDGLCQAHLKAYASYSNTSIISLGPCRKLVVIKWLVNNLTKFNIIKKSDLFR